MSAAYDVFIAVDSHEPGEHLVKVNGPIGADNAVRQQEALLDGLIATPPTLMVDLAAVDSIDGTGLDVLVGAHRRAAAAGTGLLFRHPNAGVAHLLQQNGLPTVPATIKSLTGVPSHRPRRPFPMH
jgi:anti-sigma B factor antagonist